MGKIIDNISYTVRIDSKRVIAWAVVRDSEGDYEDVTMHPITLDTDPSKLPHPDFYHGNNGSYIPVSHDPNGEKLFSVSNIMTVIPATNTTQVSLVLQADGEDVYDPVLHKRRVDHPLQFTTAGIDTTQWLEEQRMHFEDNMEDEFSYYFEMMEDVAERKARGEEVATY